MSDPKDQLAVAFRACLDHYGWKRDPVDHALDKALPDDPWPVHAVVVESATAIATRNPFSCARGLFTGDGAGRDPGFLERLYY